MMLTNICILEFLPLNVSNVAVGTTMPMYEIPDIYSGLLRNLRCSRSHCIFTFPLQIDESHIINYFNITKRYFLKLVVGLTYRSLVQQYQILNIYGYSFDIVDEIDICVYLSIKNQNIDEAIELI